MSQIIKPKRGTTVPTTGNLVDGEIAINLSANTLHVNDSGVIKTVADHASAGYLTTATGDVRYAQITGATFSGDLAITSSTASSSTITGAVTVDGGVGVTGAVHANAFHGDGSNLTGIEGTVSVDESGRAQTGNWLEFGNAGADDRLFFAYNPTVGNVWQGGSSAGYQFNFGTINTAVSIDITNEGPRLLGHSYVSGAVEGLILDTGSGLGSTPTLFLRSNGNTGATIRDGVFHLDNIPTSDPSSTNAVWSDGGVVVLSGSTAPASGLNDAPSDGTIYGRQDGSWVETPSSGTQVQEVVFIATAGQTLFSTTYVVGNIEVFLNGVKLVATTDFTATNGTSITLTEAATLNDVVTIIKYSSITIANPNSEIDGGGASTVYALAQVIDGGSA